MRNNTGDNVQIVGNSCQNLGEVALFVEFGFNGCVVANNLVDRASVGISITNFNEGGGSTLRDGQRLRPTCSDGPTPSPASSGKASASRSRRTPRSQAT